MNGESEWRECGFANKVHIVTHDNIEFDGGKKSLFDPDKRLSRSIGKDLGKVGPPHLPEEHSERPPDRSLRPQR
jgi:hypothetical protein